MARNFRYVIATLTAKHARLQGAAMRDGPDRQSHLDNLHHIERTILLFDADWQPPEPVIYRIAPIMGKRGSCIRQAMAVLRNATRPLSSREIAEAITSPEHVTGIASTVHTVLDRRLDRGVVKHLGYPVRWSLNV